MSAAELQRRILSVSRAADFLEQRALVSQTGQPAHRFGDVVLKELLDNALDAAESAGTDPVIDVTVTRAGDVQLVTVADNGAGIAPDVVTRVLDFTTLTSDKALYRSPCRGAQGNALKTIIGIPHALGIAEPVVIESRGIRHVVVVSLDAAGNVAVRHDQHESARATGTSITVSLPVSLTAGVRTWAQRYALVNPHATFTVADLGHDDDAEDPEIYKATAGDGWAKPLPGDPTSPWWYDIPAFTKLACSLAAAGDDRPVGAFLAEFRGLSGTAKRSQIAAAADGIRRVSDLAARPGAAAILLPLMQAAAAEPKFTVLGQVPEQHYRQLLHQMAGVERFWYRHAGIVHDGVPWHIEVAIADINGTGAVIYACNYAASFGDPLGRTRLTTADVQSFGAASFLDRCDATPSHGNGQHRAAVVHVTCAAPVFTDKGKTQLDVPDEVAAVFAKTLWQAGKELYREKRQSDRAERREDAAAERARRAANRPRISQKDAVFAVIPAAVEAQRGGTSLPFSAHSLFYKIRPLFLELLPGKTLDSKYCEQTLIPAYEREFGAIAGMYREPRGELHEPHAQPGRGVVMLGTREVSTYIPPAWTFDKILVVEKAGLWPVLDAAGIAGRYDMAIITSEGFGSVACRELLASMPPGDVRIFCIHDADHSGYNIARTLGEETIRMPGHHVNMTDLGLTVDAAITSGMQPETYTRESALPAGILPHLTPAAREWFTGQAIDWDYNGKPRKWACRRVELNAFTSPGLIAYIEDGLGAAGADGKVVPPAAVIEAQARDAHRDLVRERVEQIIAELVDTDAIADALVAETAGVLDFTISPDDIRAQLQQDRARPWRHVVSGDVAGRLDGCGVSLSDRVAALIRERP